MVLLGRLVRTISSKVTAFLADETTVMLFLSVLGNIFYVVNSEVVFSKPVFETEQLLVTEQLVFEVKDSGKRRDLVGVTENILA